MNNLVIGIIVAVLLVVAYKRLVQYRCNTKYTYFDKTMHIPLLRTVEEKDYTESLNDKSTNIPRRQRRYALVDQMSPRWNGGQKSQSDSDPIGRREDNLESVTMTPSRMHHGRADRNVKMHFKNAHATHGI